MTSMVRGCMGALVLAGMALSASPGQAQYYSPYPPPPGYYVPAQPPPPPPRDLNRAYDPTRDGPLGYPTQRGPVLMGTTCYAGNYVCQVYPQPAGSGCTCPAIGAPSYGTVR